MNYCDYCHQYTKPNRYHPLTCGQCGAEYAATPEQARRNEIITQALGKTLTPESAAGMNQAAQGLRRAQDELTAAMVVQQIRIGDAFAPKMSEWIGALKTPS